MDILTLKVMSPSKTRMSLRKITRQHSKSLRWHYEKRDLTSAVDAAKLSAKEALQTVYDALNTGQKKQIIKNETVKALLGLHGVVRK